MAIKVTFETTTCGRCGGCGRYSYNQMHGSTCYGCGGSGRVFSKRGAASRVAFKAERERVCGVPVESLVAGDSILVDGKFRTVEGWEGVTADGATTLHGLLRLVVAPAKAMTEVGAIGGLTPSTVFVKAATAEQWAQLVEFAHTLPGALVGGEWSRAMQAAESKTPEQLARDAGKADRAVAAKARRADAKAAKAAKEAAEAGARLAALRADTIAKHGVLLAEVALRLGTDPVAADVLRRIEDTGRLSDRQADMLADMLARAAKAETTEFFGTVGAKVAVPVKVTRCGRFERPAFGRYGATETVHVTTMTDDAGHVFVVKSPAFTADEGAAFTLRATIKAHDEYRGVKQTVVIRAAIVD